MKTKKQKAFSLVELLIAIAIIAVLILIAVYSVGHSRAKSRDNERLNDINHIQMALEKYYNHHNHYPSTLEELTSGSEPYLSIIPQAPVPPDEDCSEEDNHYTYVPLQNNSSYILSFCLGSKTGEMEAGIKLADAKGIGDPPPPPPPFVCGDNITDTRDQNVYPTVKIGNQCWMAKNLAYLPAVSGPSDGSYSIPKYYVHGYNGTDVAAAKATADYTTYGVLYNHPAAIQERICPEGWRIPTDGEWITLTSYLGGQSVAGGKMKEVGTSHWFSPNTGATNEYGFTALPAGNRYGGGYFNGLSAYAYFWSSSLAGDDVLIHYLYYDWGAVGRGGYDRSWGYSLRCLRTNND